MREEVKRRHAYIILTIIVLFLLWGFYLIQEEFANYGMYQLISYTVHEISSLIPIICILATIIGSIYLLVRTIKKKADRVDKVLLAVFILCFAFLVGYFHQQSKMVFTAAICTVDEVNEAEGKIVVSIDGRTEKLELESPMLVNGMLIEKEQRYLIDYMWNKDKPNEGELHMISLVD